MLVMKRNAAICLAHSLAVICSTATYAADRTASFKEAQQFMKFAAERARKRVEGLSFEEFKATVYKEPFEDGKYIVNGDTPISTEEDLRDFYERNIKNRPAPVSSRWKGLVVNRHKDKDDVWDKKTRRALTYCVSTTLGTHHAKVVQNMEAAAKAWEAIVDLKFVYKPSEDNRCDQHNESVIFDVRQPPTCRPADLARAFFPSEPRPQRNVVICDAALNLDPSKKLNLAGVLRHELGHAIGLRHEHTRPESGACFEDNDWRPLTDYDAFSVMHYPQCNGKGDWTLRLTDEDKFGAACLYGPAAGFQVDCAGEGDANTLAGAWMMAETQGILEIEGNEWRHPEMGIADLLKGRGAANYEVQYRHNRGVICAYRIKKTSDGHRLILEPTNPTQPADFCPSGILPKVGS